ncbi:glyoxalase [Nocardioides sambongensis]|uniref:glyoxalase n=1 Tax=Nocardioides sambongensis TaxID=2589074 RepID=UPI0011282CAC|nr:glyoxalase [Nocardioides sambongensis]
MGITIDELQVADNPEAWRGAGFAVDDDGVCRVGTVRIRLVGPDAGRGIVGWSLRGTPDGVLGRELDGLLDGVLDGVLDGIATGTSAAAPATPATHPNGVTHIDHLVLTTPDLARTAAALRTIGLEARRERDGMLSGEPVRQVFYRLSEVILEVVGPPGGTSDEPSRLWGVTHVVADIDAAAARLGDALGPVKDAVQPGRRIATLRNREIGISVRTALISPHVRR